MSITDENSPSLEFKNFSEARMFCRRHLSVDPANFQHEFEKKDDFNEFIDKRNAAIMGELIKLVDLNFEKCNTITKFSGTYKRIVPAQRQNIISDAGSDHKSTRFNFKNIPFLKNRVLYFGKTRKCCETEIFHLEIQKQMLKNKIKNESDDLDIIFAPQMKYKIYEHKVDLEKVLVVTTQSCCDSLGIKLGAIFNEWQELNEQYDIPSASQILGAMAKKNEFQAILYRSVRDQSDQNLVVFTENIGNKVIEDKIKFINSDIFHPTTNLYID